MKIFNLIMMLWLFCLFNLIFVGLAYLTIEKEMIIVPCIVSSFITLYIVSKGGLIKL